MRKPKFDYLADNSAPYLRHTDFADSQINRNRLGCIIALLETAEVSPGKHSLLEVGCGIGNVCLPLAGLGYDIKAIDIDGVSTGITAQRNIFDNLRVETLAVEDEDIGAYDVVILTEVLEHLSDAEIFFKNIVKRMKSDSWMILTVPNGRGICELVLRPGYYLKSHNKCPQMIKAIRRVLGTRELTTANVQTPHLQFFTWKRINKMFDQNPLRVVSFQGLFFLWVLLESLFSSARLPGSLARWDYLISQKLPPIFSANWLFLLQKI